MTFWQTFCRLDRPFPVLSILLSAVVGSILFHWDVIKPDGAGGNWKLLLLDSFVGIAWKLGAVNLALLAWLWLLAKLFRVRVEGEKSLYAFITRTISDAAKYLPLWFLAVMSIWGEALYDLFHIEKMSFYSLVIEHPLMRAVAFIISAGGLWALFCRQRVIYCNMKIASSKIFMGEFGFG